MACRDDYVDTGLDYKNGLYNGEHQVRAELEPLLCEACELLEKHNLGAELSEALKKWAAEHEIKEVERVKTEALAKLSPKERRALGLEK